MPTVSQFSTAENYAKLQESLKQIDTAINEAEIAKQAGLPDAEQLLSTAQEAKKRILQMLNTYFPSGTAPG